VLTRVGGAQIFYINSSGKYWVSINVNMQTAIEIIYLPILKRIKALKKPRHKIATINKLPLKILSMVFAGIIGLASWNAA